MADVSRVLVVGSGGRESALALALARCPGVDAVTVAPGNPGCDRPAAPGQALIRSAPLSLGTHALQNPTAAIALAKETRADLVVIGPETPLVAGWVDAMSSAGIVAFGPTAAAAKLEGSKAFLKTFALDHKIPTAAFLITSSIDEASAYIDQHPSALVVKTDGLAGGKGALVTNSPAEAKAAARRLLVDRDFGDAGATIIIEDKIVGREVSVHAICDGERFVILPLARDHKRIGDHDEGPNTGGMGAIAPVALSSNLQASIIDTIIIPTLRGMAALGAPFRGVLFAGIMIDENGTPWLLEHNVRFGDPETQAILPLLAGNLAHTLHAAASGRLSSDPLQPASGLHSTVIVVASAGYPTASSPPTAIHGLDASWPPEVDILHAGTTRDGATIMATGGRVLAVRAVANSAAQARTLAYQCVDQLRFDGAQFRSDIGASRISGQ